MPGAGTEVVLLALALLLGPARAVCPCTGSQASGCCGASVVNGSCAECNVGYYMRPNETCAACPEGFYNNASCATAPASGDDAYAPCVACNPCRTVPYCNVSCAGQHLLYPGPCPAAVNADCTVGTECNVTCAGIREQYPGPCPSGTNATCTINTTAYTVTPCNATHNAVCGAYVAPDNVPLALILGTAIGIGGAAVIALGILLCYKCRCVGHWDPAKSTTRDYRRQSAVSTSDLRMLDMSAASVAAGGRREASQKQQQPVSCLAVKPRPGHATVPYQPAGLAQSQTSTGNAPIPSDQQPAADTSADHAIAEVSEPVPAASAPTESAEPGDDYSAYAALVTAGDLSSLYKNQCSRLADWHCPDPQPAPVRRRRKGGLRAAAIADAAHSHSSIFNAGHRISCSAARPRMEPTWISMMTSIGTGKRGCSTKRIRAPG